MKTLKNALIALLAIAAIACNGDKKPNLPERIVEDVDPNTGIISLRDYTLGDTITVAGKPYRYTLRFEHVDSMPVLINPQGLEYHESRATITIQRADSTTLFSRTYTKTSFRDQVPADFLKSSTVVGVNYNYMKIDDHSAFYFILTVGDPDETSDNMAYPLELKVSPDGSTYTIKKAENLETEPLRPGLNVDPSEDAV